MVWPSELIFVVIWLIILIGIYIGCIYHSFNRYNKAEEFSGTVLREIEPSNKEKFFRNLSLIFCVLLCFALYLKEYVDKDIINFA